MVAQMQIFLFKPGRYKLSRSDDFFPYLFPFSITVCHSPLSVIPLTDTDPLVAVYSQFASWMCMKLQRKILDLFNIPLKVTVKSCRLPPLNWMDFVRLHTLHMNQSLQNYKLISEPTPLQNYLTINFHLILETDSIIKITYTFNITF